MRLLLTQNLPYTRVHGGANRSNRFLVEALAQRGHEVEVVCPALASPSSITVEELIGGLMMDGIEVVTEDGVSRFTLDGVTVEAVHEPSRLRGHLAQRVASWSPDWVLASSEDPTQSLLDGALRATPERVVYLAHTPQMLPFGPVSMYPGAERTARIGEARAVVTISRFVADYIEAHTGFETFTNHPPHYGSGPFPHLASYDNPFVLLMNASAIKGLPIFLDMARALPELRFATLPGYATTDQDRKALLALPNVTLLENQEDLDDILGLARVVLLPSLWTEGFGMATVDAMLRGIPVLAADHGGLREAALGAAELLPVRPVEGFEDQLGDNLLPVPRVPAQDAGPWIAALTELLGDRERYESRSATARAAASDFVAGLGVAPFEELLTELGHHPERRAGSAAKVAPLEESRAAELMSGDDLDAAIAALTPDQRALLILRLAGDEAPGTVLPPVVAGEAGAEPPLSFAQQRLWFASRLDPESAAYNMSSAVRLGGAVQPAVARRALSELVRRHAVLRTSFPERDGRPYQAIAAAAPVPLPEVDLVGLPPTVAEAELLRLARADANRPFDLARGPLLRARLVRLSDGQALLINLHHAISDGWSVGLLEGEWSALYAAFAAGLPSPLPELEVQYADYATWQHRRLRGERLDEELDWWRQALADCTRPLRLPADRPEGGEGATAGLGEGANYGFQLDAETWSRLEKLARQHGASPFMLLLAAFQALLGRYTGRRRFIVGTPVAGRVRPELEGLIGFFVNTLALPADLSGNPSFSDLLQRVKETALGAFEHQEVPYEKVVEAMRAESGGATGERAAAGLFQVMFAHQGPSGLGGEGGLDRLGLRPQGIRRGLGRALFDLVLTTSVEDGRLVASLSYPVARFDAATVAAVGDHLEAMLRVVVDAPSTALEDLTLPAADPVHARLLVAAEVSPDEATAAPGEAAGAAATRPSDRRQLAARRDAEVSRKRSSLSASKRALLRQRLRQRAAGDEHSIPRRGGEGPARLSFSQQRLWFLWQLEPDSPLYNIPAAVRLSGALDAAALAAAMTAIVARHEVLRTRFAEERGGHPVQVVDPAAPLVVPGVDLTALPREPRDAEVGRLADAAAARGFDLTRSPQLRATLLRTGDDEHVALVVMHHIASDGWSASIFVRELKELYSALVGGHRPSLPALPVQYSDFAEWQREQLGGELLERQLAYWQDRLGGGLPVLEMPTDRPRPPLQTYPGATESLQLPDGLGEGFEALSRERGQTSFVTLLAAFSVLLQRYSGQDDLVVGNPTANRQHADVEDLIGFFVNTLVMRNDLSGDPFFEALMDRVREVVVGAQSHQDLPFERLVEALQPKRDPSRSPLFQVMLVQQTARRQAAAADTGLTLTPLSAEGGTAQFDLILIVSQAGPRTTCHFRYNTDLFDATTTRRMLHHYSAILEAVVEDSSRPLSRLPMLAERERHQLLAEWNDSRAAYPRDASIAEVFEARVDAMPDGVAVVAGERTLTYRQLDEAANRLARHLASMGVSPGVATGVCLPRSADLVIALLAILKAGGSFVPLDPEYPLERLSFMLEDAGIAVLVSDDERADLLPTMWTLVVSLDGDAEEIAGQEASRLGTAVPAAELAYVMYTSGSTGRPKGVAVSQRNVIRLVRGASYFKATPEDVFLLLAPVSFDASTFELWGALLNGARLVVAPVEIDSLEALGKTIRESGVTTLWLTAGLFHQMVDERLQDLAGVRQLLAGGDVLSPSHVDRVLSELPGTVLINGYGPTETTTFAACHPMPGRRPGAGTVSIGRPVANGRIHLLDPRGRPVPVGVFGELMIGGDGVARGYHGRPGLTAERFVPDATGQRSGARLYRTGDLARHLGDGRLEFSGRRDLQVKVRGFRIELREVEAALTRHPAVEVAAVAAPADAQGNRRLVAYYVPRQEGWGADGVAAGELGAALRGELPEFMVPSLFVPLPQLPLGATGKVDRKALPAPEDLLGDLAPGQMPPRNVVEEVMAEVWAQVLELPSVGVHDDFFAIGGHSLLGTLLVTRMREALGVEVTLRHLFETPTIAELALVADAGMRDVEGAAVPPITPVSRQGRIPVSFSQQRLWFLHRLDPDSPMYNVPAPVRVSGALEALALEAALAEIERRHEALRTTFEEHDGDAWQRIEPAAFAALPVVDLGGLEEADREAVARGLTDTASRRPFDLTRGPLARRHLLRLESDEHVILLVMHHIVSDGWSIGVLLREVRELYDAFGSGRPSSLDELVVQYPDFAHWQRGWLQGEALEAQLDYWRQRLGDDLPPLELPFDRPEERRRGVFGSGLSRVLPADVSEGLRQLARDSGTTLFMILLAVFKALLYRYSGRADVVVGSPIANRNRAEIEPLVGFFVNTLALRTRFAGNGSFRDLLGAVRETALGAYLHQDLPFEKIVEELHPDRDLSRNPIFQVAFALQNATRETLELKGLEMSTGGGGTGVVHFDLVLSMADGEDGIKASMAFDEARFTADAAERMLGHYANLAAQVVAAPDLGLDDHQVMDEGETGGYRPGDFPEAELSQKELESLFLELSQPGAGE